MLKFRFDRRTTAEELRLILSLHRVISMMSQSKESFWSCRKWGRRRGICLLSEIS